MVVLSRIYRIVLRALCRDHTYQMFQFSGFFVVMKQSLSILHNNPKAFLNLCGQTFQDFFDVTVLPVFTKALMMIFDSVRMKKLNRDYALRISQHLVSSLRITNFLPNQEWSAKFVEPSRLNPTFCPLRYIIEAEVKNSISWTIMASVIPSTFASNLEELERGIFIARTCQADLHIHSCNQSGILVMQLKLRTLHTVTMELRAVSYVPCCIDKKPTKNFHLWVGQRSMWKGFQYAESGCWFLKCFQYVLELQHCWWF